MVIQSQILFQISFFYFSASSIVYPACVINGAAVTKTFQIMYRNEEVRLEDCINFKIHAIVEAGKVRIKKTKKRPKKSIKNVGGGISIMVGHKKQDFWPKINIYICSKEIIELLKLG